MAAPIYNVSPQMGSDLIIVVFAVVVIGGMGSIMGAIVTGFGLGVIEGLTKVFYPGGVQHRDLRHHGDRAADPAGRPVRTERVTWQRVGRHRSAGAVAARAPSEVDRVRRDGRRCSSSRRSFVYPVFLMKALCFALFACAFNLLIGYVGLLSFGHALFFGWASYVCGPCRQGLGLPAGARDPRRHRGRRRARRWSPARSRSAGRASISR